MRKTLLMLLLITGYLASSSVLALGPKGSERVMNNGSRFCRWVLKLLGIEVRVQGQIQNGIIVANHLSYVDILAILAVRPTRFVSFAEMAKLPGVGWITQMSQTLFVNRSNPSLIKKDIANLRLKGVEYGPRPNELRKLIVWLAQETPMAIGRSRLVPSTT